MQCLKRGGTRGGPATAGFPAPAGHCCHALVVERASHSNEDEGGESVVQENMGVFDSAAKAILALSSF